MERGVTSVPQGFCDSAIAEFIARSSKLHNFHKSSQIFIIYADFPQILGLDATSSQRAFSQRKVVSQFEKWNEQPCVLIMPDLQELHWTNEPKVERIRTTLLGYATQTVYLLGPEPRTALDHATPLYQSPFQEKSVHSAAIFATPPGSSDKTKSYLNEWGNPEISKTARWTRDIKLHISTSAIKSKMNCPWMLFLMLK